MSLSGVWEEEAREPEERPQTYKLHRQKARELKSNENNFPCYDSTVLTCVTKQTKGALTLDKLACLARRPLINEHVLVQGLMSFPMIHESTRCWSARLRLQVRRHMTEREKCDGRGGRRDREGGREGEGERLVQT